MRIKPLKQRGKVVVEVAAQEPTLLGADFPLNIQRILVPVDFSTLSNKAFEYALAFGRQFQAQVFVIHVIEIPYGSGEAAPIGSFMEEIRKESEQSLARQIREKKTAGVSIQSLLETGIAYHEIVEAAKEHQIDLIIISTHGRTGIRHVLMGSTAERVVRHAPCPVLVVRQKEHEFIAEAGRKTGAARKSTPPLEKAAMSYQ